MDGVIGFHEVASAIIGFLFGLLVCWASRFPRDPESQIVRDMLDGLRSQRKKKRPSWPPPPRRDNRAELVREMIDLLVKKENQLNGKKDPD